MRASALGLLLPILLAGLTLSLRAGEPDPAAEEAALVEACRAATQALAPSIVRVEALGGIPPRFKAPERGGGQGGAEGVLVKRGFKQAQGPTTGLVVREDGLIATSTFPLERAPRHWIVTLADGRSLVARLLGHDPARAVALLQVEARGLPVPSFATRDEAQVGRFALSLGRGLGEGAPIASLGVISALERVGGRALQFSAACSPVNYGGPLASIEGAVFGLLVPLALDGGMASVELYDSGIGFAIPAWDLLELVGRLLKGEELQPGFLGVVPDPSHRGGGVRLAGVAPGSPAERAGLREGDVILELEGEATDAPWQLKRALGKRHAGQALTLKIKRQGDPLQVKVELEPPPGEAQ